MKMLGLLSALLGATSAVPIAKTHAFSAYRPAKGRTGALAIRRAALKAKNRKAAK